MSWSVCLSVCLFVLHYNIVILTYLLIGCDERESCLYTVFQKKKHPLILLAIT